MHLSQLAGLHSNALISDQFAKAFAKDGMAAYVGLIQRKEREIGCDVLTHQKWSGAEYVDGLLKTVTGGVSSTAAMGKVSSAFSHNRFSCSLMAYTASGRDRRAIRQALAYSECICSSRAPRTHLHVVLSRKFHAIHRKARFWEWCTPLQQMSLNIVRFACDVHPLRLPRPLDGS